MSRVLSFVFATLGVFLVTACGTLSVENKLVTMGWESPLIPGVSTTYDKPLLLEHRGVVYQIRYAAMAKLMARNLQTGADVLVWDGAADGLRSDGLSAYSDGDKLYIAWRPKLNRNNAQLGGIGDKMVYVASSADGLTFSAPKRISSADGAFPPIMTASSNGDVYVVWQDERSGKAFDMYFNVSHDQGITWKAQDVRVDVGALGESFSAEPTMAAESQFVWLAWTESTKAGFIQYVRTSDTRGETWKEPVAVRTSNKAGFFPQLVRVRGKLFLYWFDQKMVMGASSEDNGTTWKDIPTLVDVGEDGTNMQELLVKTDSAHVTHMLFGKKGPEQGDRSNVFYMRSADGINFSQPTRLNSGDMYKASSILPTMDFGPNNTVMVAWMDYRFFRPVVLGAYSADQGITWGHDALLDKGPEIGVSQFPYLLSSSGKWWLSLIRYDIQTMAQGRAVANQIDSSAMKDVVPQFGEVVFERLKGRAEKWWQSRLDADWGTSYDLSDPFVRARTAKPTYLASQGAMKYYSYEIVSIQRADERKAVVKVKYVSEMPELEINGHKYAVPKRENEVDQDWIWVDGNWYLLFKDIYGKTFLDL